MRATGGHGVLFWRIRGHRWRDRPREAPRSTSVALAVLRTSSVLCAFLRAIHAEWRRRCSPDRPGRQVRTAVDRRDGFTRPDGRPTHGDASIVGFRPHMCTFRVFWHAVTLPRCFGVAASGRPMSEQFMGEPRMIRSWLLAPLTLAAMTAIASAQVTPQDSAHTLVTPNAPASGRSGQVVQLPQGGVGVTSGGTTGYQTMGTPGGSGVMVPSGGSASTLIGSGGHSGTVTTHP
jgi:hypothetical protein